MIQSFIALISLSSCVFSFTGRTGLFQSYQSHHNGGLKETIRNFGTSKSMTTIPAAVSDSVVETSFVGRIGIDPLITNILLGASATADARLIEDIGGVLAASHGLSIWRNVLVKGRLPIESDFATDSINTWPPEPLFSSLCDAMAEIQLARFVLRHPETISAVLLSVLRLTMEFAKRLRSTNESDEETIDLDEPSELYDDADMMIEEDATFGFDEQTNEVSSEEAELLANDISHAMVEQWKGVTAGVHTLDQLFGSGHDLLDVQQGQSGAVEGFGLQDGVWQHSGWEQMPDLRRQIASMAELRELMNQIGRRPTAEGSDSIHKFASRKLDLDGGLGAQFDPSIRNSVSGLTLSGSFSEMLPFEAALLRGQSPALRRLFLAKKVESKLLSYESSGWADVPSVPRPNSRFRRRMPSAPGGPVIICLDTSWSMSGIRERLSKAVVLACVSAAHKQRRDCQVVAFSTENGVMEAGQITADATGIQRLLDFLSHSFGGGTDVTGSLKHAMTALGNDAMSAADLLLVTDGEIPDPPVSDDIMEDLHRLKRQTGMEIHGLLVGKNESKPLTMLCTETHDFLNRYDSLAGLAAVRRTTALSATSSAGQSSGNSHRGSSWGSKILPKTWMGRSDATVALFAKKKRNKRRFDDDYEYLEEQYSRNEQRWDDTEDINGSGDELQTGADSYNLEVDGAIKKLRKTVASSLQERLWDAAELDTEKHAEGSFLRYRGELKSAVDRISEGLVEREEESRLVALGMASGEHVLFLGPPGTGKSVLGRRLSKLCGGSFFQRLLTRFTTPEEIFGPLSLRALENDEYIRVTAGFLPTASVAFLDEIFKANSAILNTLLTILNERQFDNGAGHREMCPIRCVVGASNELPESDELDALYDRFLIRKEVLPVSDEGIMRILKMPMPGVSLCDDDINSTASDDTSCEVVFSDPLDEVIRSLSAAANAVSMEDDACALMRDLRTYMREELDVDISDRRIVKAARLLKVSAAAHGRTRVDPLDCLLLQHVAWRLPEQRSAIKEWLWDHLTPGGVSADEAPLSAVAQFRLLLDGIKREALLVVRKTAGDVTGASGARSEDVATISSLRTETSNIAKILQERSSNLARHMELLRRSMDHLWLDPDEARAVQQQLLPIAEAVSTEVSRTLEDACALDAALRDDLTSPGNDVRLSVIEMLWDDFEVLDVSFTENQLSIGMKEAKAKYDADTFRKWKRERKKGANQ